jgi:multisubunit Na+/H+ antiporter MnhB subunit
VSGDTPILRVIARFAVPLTVLVAIRIFLQGARRWAWWRLSVLGLLVAIATGLVPLLRGRAYLDNTVLHVGSFHLPTATFFDAGVAMIVVGTLMTIFVELAEERR